MITKPMLAGKVGAIADIKYPVWATPKLDGIRCLKIDGKAVSRSFKPIPNQHSREMVEKHFPDGVDGELMVENTTFQEVTHAVMSEDGKPSVVYYIFDYVKGNLDVPYLQRTKDLYTMSLKITAPAESYRLILPVPINNEKELLAFEKQCLADGYEGIMLRTPNSPYKCGRSSEKEGYLLKLKRFEDAEAEIVGFEERMHNANEAKKDAFGRTERSSHQENMVPTGALGAFLVKSKEFSNQFSVGTGLTEEQRVSLWKVRNTLKGKLLKFKFQPYGVKDVPRFPVFVGLRDERDIS